MAGMRAKKDKKDKLTLIREELGSVFQSVEVYKYNPVSIRVRVIDRQFSGLSIPEREGRVQPVLDRLPGEVQADITMLLLLAPGEDGNMLLNYEFDHPSPSRL